MCGRYSLTVTLDELKEAFPDLKISLKQYAPRYNIAPTQPIAIVRNEEERKLDLHKWGLIPSWSKDAKIASKLINARGETLAEKPSFRSAYKRRRCLVLADGFYEWVQVEGVKKKIPIYVHLKTKEPFAFAGLWETWMSPDGGEIPTATIITTQPNELVAKVHSRMPVILPRDVYDVWLEPGEKGPGELDHLLKPYPAGEMAQYPVSRLVNSPANDTPQVVKPVEELELE